VLIAEIVVEELLDLLHGRRRDAEDEEKDEDDESHETCRARNEKRGGVCVT